MTVLISFEKQYVYRPSVSAVNECVPVSRFFWSVIILSPGPFICGSRPGQSARGGTARCRQERTQKSTSRCPPPATWYVTVICASSVSTHAPGSTLSPTCTDEPCLLCAGPQSSSRARRPRGRSCARGRRRGAPARAAPAVTATMTATTCQKGGEMLVESDAASSSKLQRSGCSTSSSGGLSVLPRSRFRTSGLFPRGPRRERRQHNSAQIGFRIVLDRQPRQSSLDRTRTSACVVVPPLRHRAPLRPDVARCVERLCRHARQPAVRGAPHPSGDR